MADKGGKNRKYGRNADWCKVYKASGTGEKNAKRRLRRHLIDHPQDTQSAGAYERTFGSVADIRIVEKGKSTGRLITARATRRLVRNGDQLLRARLRDARDARRHARRVMAEKLKEQDKQQRVLPTQVNHEQAVSTATR